MRFWDASAVAPLLASEAASRSAWDLLEQDPRMAVWWGTPVECVSALCRRERSGDLKAADVSRGLDLLRTLAASWVEVVPSEGVRTTALLLLRRHSLRASDGLQLAAALVAADGDPESLPVVTLDDRLALVAQREGLRTLR